MKRILLMLLLLLLSSLAYAGDKPQALMFQYNNTGYLLNVVGDSLVLLNAAGDTVAVFSRNRWQVADGYSLPVVDGTANYVLKTNGSGVVSWAEDAGAAGGETNTLGDTGTFNGTEGFGLAGGKTGSVLKVKGLIEGTNITIAASGDSAFTITSSGGGGGNWTDSTGFLVGWGGVAKSVVNDTNYFRFEGGVDFDTTGGSVSIVDDSHAHTTTTISGLVDGDMADAITVDPINATTETAIEAVIDLQSLQGAVTDGQVPNNITIDEAGDLSDTLGTILRTLVDRIDSTLNGYPIDTTDGGGSAGYSDGDVLKWNAGASEFRPGADIGAGGGTSDSVYFNTVESAAGTEYKSVSNLIKVRPGTGITISREDSTTFDLIRFSADAEVNNLETDGAVGIATTEIYIGTGAGTGAYAALSGDVTMDNTGDVTITSVDADVVLLNEIGDPGGDASIAMGTRSIVWNFNTPVSSGFEVLMGGNFTDHAFHVHQTTGNPSTVHLVHFESDDPDVLPLCVITAGRDSVAAFIGGEVFMDSLDVDGKATIDSLEVAGVAATGALTVTGNIAVSGTVDGVDVAALNTGVATDSVDWNDAADHSVNNSQAHTDYMLNTGDVVTGVYDFGGATSLEIPNGVDPAVTVEGHWAWDNNDDAGVVYSGDEGEKVFMPIYHHIVIPLTLPDSIQVYTPKLFLPKFNALMYPHGVEIDLISLSSDTTVSSISVVVEEWSGADPPVYQATITTIATVTETYVEEVPDTDGNLDANDRLVIVLPAGTGLDFYNIEIFFHVTAGN